MGLHGIEKEYEMKICQINCVYGVLSTGKIVRDIHQSLLKKGIQSIVIVPRKSTFTNENGVFVFSNLFLSYLSAFLRRLLGMTFDWAHLQTYRMINILKREHPDIVHLHCINGNDINIYKIHKYLSKHRIKTVYTLHAEFPYTGGCGNTLECKKWLTGCGTCPNLKKGLQSYLFDGTGRTWRKQKKSYELYDKSMLVFTAVSPWLLKQAELSPIISGIRKMVVQNGVDTNVFNYEKQSQAWRNLLGIRSEVKIILYVTAFFYPNLNDLKGGRYIIELSRLIEGEPIIILVAANHGEVDALPENVRYIGSVKSQQELAELYREADITILTSKNETFSMPVAESLCCGTPVVGFEAGGPESICLPEYCTFVEYGNVEALNHAIKDTLEKKNSKKEISENAIAKYSRKRMVNDYIDVYKELA